MFGRLQLDQSTQEYIRNLALFICLLPDGQFIGTEGEAHLEYAISLNKDIVVWRLSGRAHIPIPDALADYGNCIIVEGTEEDLAKAVGQYLQLLPDDEIVIRRMGYSN